MWLISAFALLLYLKLNIPAAKCQSSSTPDPVVCPVPPEDKSPYVKVRRRKNAGDLDSLDAGGFLDLSSRINVLLCINGPAILLTKYEERGPEKIPTFTGPHPLKIYRHHCSRINVVEDGSLTSVTSPKAKVRDKVTGIHLIGESGDFSKPSLVFFNHENFGHWLHPKGIVDDASFITISQGSYCFKLSVNDEFRVSITSGAGPDEICTWSIDMDPGDQEILNRYKQIFKTSHSRDQYVSIPCPHDVLTTTPDPLASTTISPTTDEPGINPFAIIDPHPGSEEDSDEMKLVFKTTTPEPGKGKDIELRYDITVDKKCVRLFDDPSDDYDPCNSKSSSSSLAPYPANRDKTLDLISQFLTLNKAGQMRSLAEFDDLAWKKEILNLLAEIYGKICEPFPRSMAFSVMRMLEFYLHLVHEGDVSEPPQWRRKKDSIWRHLEADLKICRKAATQPIWYEWRYNEGGGDTDAVDGDEGQSSKGEGQGSEEDESKSVESEKEDARDRRNIFYEESDSEESFESGGNFESIESNEFESDENYSSEKEEIGNVYYDFEGTEDQKEFTDFDLLEHESQNSKKDYRISFKNCNPILNYCPAIWKPEKDDNPHIGFGIMPPIYENASIQSSLVSGEEFEFLEEVHRAKKASTGKSTPPVVKTTPKPATTTPKPQTTTPKIAAKARAVEKSTTAAPPAIKTTPTPIISSTPSATTEKAVTLNVSSNSSAAAEEEDIVVEFAADAAIEAILEDEPKPKPKAAKKVVGKAASSTGDDTSDATPSKGPIQSNVMSPTPQVTGVTFIQELFDPASKPLGFNDPYHFNDIPQQVVHVDREVNGGKSSIFYYEDTAELEYELNLGIDLAWKVFATVAGYCNQHYAARQSETFPRLFSTFSEDFLEPVGEYWMSGGDSDDNEILRWILSEWNSEAGGKWVDSCLEGSYLDSNTPSFRPPRPLLVSAASPKGFKKHGKVKASLDRDPNSFVELPPKRKRAGVMSNVKKAGKKIQRKKGKKRVPSPKPKSRSRVKNKS